MYHDSRHIKQKKSFIFYQHSKSGTRTCTIDMTQFALLYLVINSLPFTVAFSSRAVFKDQVNLKRRLPIQHQSKIILLSSLDNDPEPTHDGSKRDFSQAQANFLESSARDGSSAVRHMSIEERTKRALLAEAAEDRMVKLTDDLDKLLDNSGIPKNIEDREEAVKIARQIKASQEQYRSLVNGEPSPLLDALDGKMNNKGRDS